MMSEAVKKLMEIMGYEEGEKLPSMKSLRQHFRKLAVETHPDKGGSNEKFKELYKAYETLGNLIDSQKTGEEDNEEIEARRMFREENFEEVNSASVTLRVNATDAWEDVLKENFGEPKQNSSIASENKGERYNTTFSHDGEECNMTITIYRPKKGAPGKRTILIQAERTKHSFIVPFVDFKFPKLYQEVKKKREPSPSKGRNLRSHKRVSYSDDKEIDESIEELFKLGNKTKFKQPKVEVKKRKCLLCKFTTTTVGILREHTRRSHSETRMLNCNFCETKEEKRSDLMKHMNTHHKQTETCQSNIEREFENGHENANSQRNKSENQTKKENTSNENENFGKFRFQLLEITSQIQEKALTEETEASNTTTSKESTQTTDQSEDNFETDQNVTELIREEKKEEDKIQCQICDLQVPDRQYLVKHIRGSHGINKIGSKIKENNKNFEQCEQSNEKTQSYFIEMTKEKERRILLESSLEIKSMNLKLKTNENEKLKDQITNTNGHVQKEVNDLKNQIEKMKKEHVKKEKTYKSIEKELRQREKDNTKLINELTDENKRLSNENDLYKKLYQEEKDLRVNNVLKGSDGNEYIDYDNLTDDELIDDEDTWTQVKTKKRGKRFNCTKCKFSSINKSEVTKHEETHEKKIQCNHCNFETNNKNEMASHNKIHVQKVFKCVQCDYVANSERNLKIHVKITMNHCISLEETPIENKVKCTKCNKYFKDKNTMQRHTSTEHIEQQQKIQCNLCEFKAANKEVLQKHMRVAMGHRINIVCRFFQRGNCKKGKFCRFEHSTEVMSNKSNDWNQSGRMSNSSFEFNKQCKFYDQCFKFPACGFTHYELCKYQERCFRKDACRFIHLPNSHFLEVNQNRGLFQ